MAVPFLSLAQVRRRHVLAMLMGLPFARVAKASLRQEAARAAMLFGCAVRADQLFADTDFRAAIVRECGEITPELELKWDFVEKRAGTFDFSSADQLATFAAKQRKAMHGHCLLWHEGVPEWAAPRLAEEGGWALIERYVRAIVSRYRPVVQTWDVINEPIDVSGPEGLRAAPFLNAFGAEYIGRALTLTNRLAPKAKLFINEFGLLYDRPEDRAKRATLLALVQRLKRKGVPLHGIGVQAHLELQHQHHFNPAAFADFLNAIGALGLEIRLTELDVKEGRTDIPPAQRDAQAGVAVKEVLDVAIANRAVGTLTSWGLSDRYSWLPQRHEQAGLNRGLPLNSDLQPKPIYRAIKEALSKR